MTKQERLEKLKRLRELKLKRAKLLDRSGGISAKSIEAQKPDMMAPLRAVGEALGTGAEYYDRYSPTGAPLRKAVGEAIEGEPPQDIVKSYAEQFGEPTATAPTGADLARGIGISDKPIAKKTPLLKDISPADVAGFAGEMAVDVPGWLIPSKIAKPGAKLLAGSRPVRAARHYFAKKAIKSTEKAIHSALGSMSASARKKYRDDVIAKVMLEHNIQPLLKSPSKALSKLRGEGNVLDLDGYRKFKEAAPIDLEMDMSDMVGKSGGDIGDLVDTVNGYISTANASGAPKVRIRDIVDELYSKKLMEARDPLSGVPADSKMAATYRKNLIEYLKPGRSGELNLVQLHNKKKNLGAMIKSTDFYREGGENLAAKREAMVDAYRALKEAIETSANRTKIQIGDETVWAGDAIKNANERIGVLIEIADFVKSKKSKELSPEGFIEFIANTGAGGVLGAIGGQMTGNPLLGAAIGAGVGYARKPVLPGKFIRQQIPQLHHTMEKVLDAPLLEKQIKYQTPLGKQITIEGERNRREPQSLSIPEELETMDIPRSSQKILENPDATIAIAAQRNPEFAALLEQLVRYQPEKMKTAMPGIIQQFPDMFEPDEFDSYDNKITSPQGMEAMMSKLESMIKSGNISTVEATEIADRMHNGLELPIEKIKTRMLT